MLTETLHFDFYLLKFVVYFSMQGYSHTIFALFSI